MRSSSIDYQIILDITSNKYKLCPTKKSQSQSLFAPWKNFGTKFFRARLGHFSRVANPLECKFGLFQRVFVSDWGRLGMLNYLPCYFQITTFVISSHLWGSFMAIFDHLSNSVRAFLRGLPKLSSWPPRLRLWGTQSVSILRRIYLCMERVRVRIFWNNIFSCKTRTLLKSQIH